MQLTNDRRINIKIIKTAQYKLKSFRVVPRDFQPVTRNVRV